MTEPTSLHPNAKETLDQRARKLVGKFGPPRPSENPPRRPSLLKDRQAWQLPISWPLQGTGRDTFGKTTSRFVVVDHKHMGLYSEDYVELVKVAENLLSSANLKDVVSSDFIVEKIFAWVERANRDEVVPEMTDEVLRECRQAVGKLEITIPVNGLRIESDFAFGRVRFHRLRPALFDGIDAALAAYDDVGKEDREAIERWAEKKRLKLQGLVAISMSLEAERTHAVNVAAAEAERSLALLRIFHPAHTLPEVTAYCTLYGHEHLKKEVRFVSNDGAVPAYEERVVSVLSRDWGITNSDLIVCRSLGLDILGGVLVSKSRSELEDKVINAMMLYSEGVLKHTITERLLYYLAALESLLLKDPNEPIQKNIGERLAFFLEGDVDKRLAIVANVDEVYRRRSQFVHHGKQVEYEEPLDQFCEHVHCFFTRLPSILKRYRTKGEFLKMIERIKFS